MAAEIKIVVSSVGSGSALKDAKNDVESLGSAAEKSGGGFSTLQKVGVAGLAAIATATVAAGVGVAKFVTDSVGLAGNFEAGMNAFGAAAGAGFEPGSAALNEFKDLFISLGKELPVSTTEVQEAATTLIKAGIDPAVVKAGALRDSLQFAAAAGMELADAAELTTKMLGTFVPMGASVTEQTEFMANAQELMTKAANASTLDVQKLGDAMLQAAGAVKGAGIDYQDFVTTMGLISPAFGSAAEAGTSFKNLVARFVPSTKAATEAMSGLGLMTTSTTRIMQFLKDNGVEPLGTDIDTLGNQFTEFAVKQGFTAKETQKVWDSFAQSKFFDMDGKFIGMRDAAELLKQSFGGLSDAQRTEALSTIFGNDAKGAAIALISAGSEQYDLFAQKMMEANGVQAQAAATQQGFNFQMENLKGSIEALQIVVGTALLPVLSDFLANYVTPGVNQVMAFAESIANAANPVQALVSSIDQVIPGFSGMLAAAEPIAAFLVSHWQPILAGVAAMLGGAMVAAIASAVASILSLAAPILAAVALGAALYAAWESDWGGIRTVVTNVAGYLGSLISAWLGELSAFWDRHGADILTTAQQAWTSIQQIVTGVLQILDLTIGERLRSATAWVQQHGAEIQLALDIAWAAIKTIVQTALALIQGVINTTLALIKGDWQGALDALQQTQDRILGAIIANFREIFEGIRSAVVTKVQELAAAVPSILLGLASQITGLSPQFISSALSIGGGIITGIINGVKNGVGALVGAVVDAAKRALEAAKDALGIASPSKMFADLVGVPMMQGMALGVTRGAPLVQAAVTQASGGALSTAQQTSSSVVNNFNYSPTYGSAPNNPSADFALMRTLAKAGF
ncbi:MAG TPA: phage tail tape measure protein [Herpetosiphonaceae bacterium]